MEQQHQKSSREKVEEEEEAKKKQDGKDPPTPSSTASPPSASSSPSHEFSFTISLHSTIHDHKSKTKSSPPPFAIDLTPADDIFFHGHLLPLHLLSHLPVSPRSSTNSLDSFTLPIRELIEDQNPIRHRSNSSNINVNHCQSNYSETKGRPKSKSFSLFGLRRWRKGYEDTEKEEKEKHKRKLSHVLKRYVRMVRPLLLFRGRREKIQLRRQPYSFSGNLSLRSTKQELRGKRGEFSAFSAPASMRTSPSNSGLLVATATIPSSASNSTIEELQSAIQAAIAHCKNSIAVEEKLQLQD